MMEERTTSNKQVSAYRFIWKLSLFEATKQNYQSLRNISGEVWNYSGYANLAPDNGQIIFYDDGTFAMDGFFDGSPYSVSGEFYVDFNNGIFMISPSEMGTMTYYITSTDQNSFSISNPLSNTYYDLALN